MAADQAPSHALVFQFVAALPHAQEITLVDNSFNIIEVVTVDGDLRMTLRNNQLKELFDGRSDLDRDDLSSRRHDFPCDLVAELDDGLNHFPLVLFEDAFFLTGIDEGLNLFFRGFLFFFRLVPFFCLMEIIHAENQEPRNRIQRQMHGLQHRE